MERAKDILPLVYRQGHPASKQKDEELILSYWESSVGPQIARRTKPIRLLQRRLIVDVDGQEWRRELASMSQRIAGRLNAEVGKDVLDDVEFRVMVPGRLPPAKARTAAGEPFDEASAIQDPNLRRVYRLSKKKALGK